MPPSEASRDPIQIPQEDAITIKEALLLAHEEGLSLGLSTLQRWVKVWTEKEKRKESTPVKCMLVTVRTGKFYCLDRNDFKQWVFEQKENLRPGETPRDPNVSSETFQDTTRPPQTSRDPDRPHHMSDDDDSDLLKLRQENVDLKIDLEVRKQLLTQAAIESTRQRDRIETLLRENGGLQSQLRQLSSGTNLQSQELPPASERDDEAPPGVDNPVP